MCPLARFRSHNLLTHLPGCKLEPVVVAAIGTPNFAPPSWFPFVLPVITRIKWGQSWSVKNCKLLEVPASSIRGISSPLRPEQNPAINQTPISAVWSRIAGRSDWLHSCSKIDSIVRRTSIEIGSSCLLTSPTRRWRPPMKRVNQKEWVGTPEIHILFFS